MYLYIFLFIGGRQQQIVTKQLNIPLVSHNPTKIPPIVSTPSLSQSTAPPIPPLNYHLNNQPHSDFFQILKHLVTTTWRKVPTHWLMPNSCPQTIVSRSVRTTTPRTTTTARHTPKPQHVLWHQPSPGCHAHLWDPSAILQGSSPGRLRYTVGEAGRALSPWLRDIRPATVAL